MSYDDLLIATHNALTRGPSRVIVDAEGLGVGSQRAREQYGVRPTVIFIREDGWTLGAPAQFAGVAESLYRDSWAGVVRAPNTTPEVYKR